MPNPIPTLTDAAEAVAALGSSQAYIDLLDDASLQAGIGLLRELDQQLQPYRLWMSAAIARRSDHSLGYSGLARKNGFPTPATFIQSMTGTSKDEAVKLARLGEMMVEAESADPVEVNGAGEITGGSGGTAIATAATAGGISLDCADAIRRGLGEPHASVTAEQLRMEAEKLIAHAASGSAVSVVTPEALLTLARQARERLDASAVDRGQRERSTARSVRIWEKDGMFGGSWKLTGEDGGVEINTALKLLLAKNTGGPRFPSTGANGASIEQSDAEAALEDDRSMDQIVADGFTQIVLNGLHVDPTVVPGVSRAAVRVVVSEKVLEEAAAGSPTGTATLEENLTSITFSKLEEYLCEGGTVGVLFAADGTINVGREQRPFTARQRTALGVRDGGCRIPGCTRPPSWCEAHHIAYWARDGGRTEIENGILLCRFHHMFVHDKGWEILRDDGPGGGSHWLRPPESVDPERQLIEMPSKNPLVAAMQRALSA
jgi:hypothetical protein